MFRKFLFISLLVAPGLVLANDLSQEELTDLLEVKIRFARHMALNPSIVRAVEAQNSEQLALAERIVCAVSGDTLPQKKPDPAPLIHACAMAGVEPPRAVYVGDAARDIEAYSPLREGDWI